MPPDLNSLPPPRSMASSPLQPRNRTSSLEGNNNNSQISSPNSSSAAMMTTADLSHRSSLNGHRSSPQNSRPSISESSRRRSGIGIHLNLNDPAGDHNDHRSSISSAFRTASPTSLGGSPIIATGDPHHQRAPSLGEIHQELEQEQEAQVNRLLQMIRQQQAQLQQLQLQQQQQPQPGTAVVDDSTSNSERSASFPSIPPLPMPGSRPMQIPLSLTTRRGSRSRTSSQATSPSLHPAAPAQLPSAIEPAHGSFNSEWSVLGGGIDTGASARRGSRDESSFYQAEATMLSRENQMLRMRIRDLERQISELSTINNATNPSASESAPAENLHVAEPAASTTRTSVAEEEAEKT